MIQERAQSAVGFTPKFTRKHYESIATCSQHLRPEECRALYVGILEFWESLPLSVGFARICRDNGVSSNAALSWLHIHGFAGRVAKRANAGTHLLTEKQMKVVSLTAAGLSMAEIGKQLGAREKTVGHIRVRAYRALGINDIATLTRYALAKGWVRNEFEPNESLTETAPCVTNGRHD